jgi:hypothetical protein
LHANNDKASNLVDLSSGGFTSAPQILTIYDGPVCMFLNKLYITTRAVKQSNYIVNRTLYQRYFSILYVSRLIFPFRSRKRLKACSSNNDKVTKNNTRHIFLYVLILLALEHINDSCILKIINLLNIIIIILVEEKSIYKTTIHIFLISSWSYDKVNIYLLFYFILNQ